MPSDVSVKAVGLVLSASENPAGPQTEKFTPPAQAPPAASPVIVANPSLRFDPVSGLVVMEFHDAAGDVTSQIPTLQQLEAYRIWGQPVPSLDTPGADTLGSTASKPAQAVGHAAAGAATPAVGTRSPAEHVPTPAASAKSPAAGIHASATSTA